MKAKYIIQRLKTWKILYKKKFHQRFSPLRHDKALLFILLCHPRSGSTWLHTLLNSHPNILSLGENDFSKKKFNDSGKSSLTEIIRHQPKSIKAIGIKLFFKHLVEKDKKWILQELIQNKNIKIIHLSRSNQIRSYISLQLARKTGKFSSTNLKNNIENSEKIFINPVECCKQIDILNSYEMIVLNSLIENEILLVKYEDLQADLENQLSIILNFLELNDFKCFSLLKKQNSGNLEDIIANYHEFKSHIQKTKWSDYI